MQFLMIARANPATPIEKILPYVKPEAAKSWEFYAAGMLRSMHYIADMSGVVFIWEAESLEAVNAAIDQLPMKRDNILDFTVLPLMPYTGLSDLFAK
jgi:Muconolactone delta-isomerase